jgi:hypothetical protein
MRQLDVHTSHIGGGGVPPPPTLVGELLSTTCSAGNSCKWRESEHDKGSMRGWRGGTHVTNEMVAGKEDSQS